MNNPFKAGDKFTFKDDCLHYDTYRDCSKGTTYTVVEVGTKACPNEPTAVSFKDDVGDNVVATTEHLIEV